MGIGSNQPEALLTVEEVARRLRVPKSWVYEHTRPSSNPQIPHLKLGKYLRFRPPDIEDFVRQGCGDQVAYGTDRR